LVLRLGRHVPVRRKMRQDGLDLLFTHFARMAPLAMAAMEAKKLQDPIPVRLLRP